MPSPSPLILGVAAAGLVFIWSAVHGANINQTFKDLLAGHTTNAPGTDPALTDVSKLGRQLPGDVDTPQENAPRGDGSPSGNRANGQLQAAAHGWTGSQWTALEKLWTRESDWSNTAQNPTSTAYGIAQFLDTTWAKYGPKTSDPTLQIRYGLAYIADRYGTPTAAWAHELAVGWY
jgi:hypothetical protein